MVYGIVKLINFAHGDILMVGAYLSYFVLTTFGFTPWSLAAAFLLAIVGSVVLGVGIEASCYRPLRNAPRINALITAIGVSIVLENFPRVFPFIGSDYRNLAVPSFFDNITFGEVTIIPIKLITLVVTLVLMGLLILIVDYSKSGKAMRAVSYDMGASALMGISVNRTVSFTFALGRRWPAPAASCTSSTFPSSTPTWASCPASRPSSPPCWAASVPSPGPWSGGSSSVWPKPSPPGSSPPT